MTIRRPNFLVIGAQKCGTSYLCAALARHPSVFHSNPKELLFFQRKDVTPVTFDAYLHQHFSGVKAQTAVGEGSTVYFQWPNALKNIRACLGRELKLIVCLRHPTDRAVSFYLHNVRKGRMTGTEPITRLIGDIRTSPITSSFYAEHVERWQDAYRDQLCFLLFDELLQSPSTFVRQATDFLCLEAPHLVREKPVNQGFELKWENDALRISNVGDGPLARIRFPLGELEALHEMFAADVARTEVLLGRSLAAWKRLPAFTDKQQNW